MPGKKVDKAALVHHMETSDSSPEKHSKSGKSKPKKEVKQEGNGDHMETENLIPPELLRRINALRKLQLQTVGIETEFYSKLHELEMKFSGLMAPLHEKREKIVNGTIQPSDDDCDISLPFEQTFVAEELEKQAAIVKDLPESDQQNSGNGIDEFWLTVLRNDGAIGGMIEGQDEKILRHLTNITVKVDKDPMKFTLFFHFSPNDYFTNTILTKEYSMSNKSDPLSPWDFEGPEIIGCTGCTIDWKEGKNATIKVVTKKRKHKQNGEKRIVSKEERTDSFFNFFSPPVPGDQSHKSGLGTDILLEFDYEHGQMFRDRIVPRAVLLYTGEAIDEDYEDDSDEDEDDLDGDEDMDDEDTD